MRRNLSVPIVSRLRQPPQQQQKEIHSSNNPTYSFHKFSNKQPSNNTSSLHKKGSTKPHLPSPSTTNQPASNHPSPSPYPLLHFTKQHQSSEQYIKDFTHLRRSSFFMNNKLTKSVFDITDAVMLGKPQPFNTFRSGRGYAHEATRHQGNVGQLKHAVRAITKQNKRNMDKGNNKEDINNKKSHIPKLYQKSLSLISSSKNRSDQFDHNRSSSLVDKSFFPTTTTALNNTISYPNSAQNNPPRKCPKPTPTIKFNKLLNNLTNKHSTSTHLPTPLSLSAPSHRLTKPLSQRKILKTDQKLTQLKHHNRSMHRLIPTPIIKPQKPTIKGKGEIVPKDRIIRVIDRLLSLIELYFQMYDQDGKRVYSFLKNVEGFQNPKTIQLFCHGNTIKRIDSTQEITKYFWAFKQQQNSVIRQRKIRDHPEGGSQGQQLEQKFHQGYKQSKKQIPQNHYQLEESIHNNQFQRPQFFGQQDYGLYKLLNNLLLKLQSKYENSQRQNFIKARELQAKRQVEQFNNLQKKHNYYQGNKEKRAYTHAGGNKSSLLAHPSPIMSITSTNPHTNRKSFLQQIKFNPINSDRKISTQIEELQDLGVKFDFKQKGRSIVLGERSKVWGRR